MSKLTDHYAMRGVVNCWDFAGHGNVYFQFTALDPGRGGRSAHWTVVRPGFKTDPKAHFLDYGNKTFYGRKAQVEVLESAKAWASASYGIKEWARTPLGSWMEAGFVKRRMAELGKPVPAAPESRKA